ncbi:MAG: SHOCT domain-containing protein [Bacteriovorax sp.]|nr:SHOCT domain-containing protein [Bacteriovorax sp.]
MNDSSGMPTMCWGGMGWSMLLLWILVTIVIVGAVSLFIRRGNINREKSALDILKERYARGEISNQEFDEKKHNILL